MSRSTARWLNGMSILHRQAGGQLRREGLALEHLT
jgi:hypothetical protein